MDREKTIVAIAVALVIAVLLIGGLVLVFIFGLSPVTMFRTASSSSSRSVTVVATAVSPSPTPTTESNSVEVTRVVVTAAPSPTPAICTPLPEDMTFTVTPTSDTAVTLELTGLQPGENLYLMFVQDKPDGEYRAEEWGMAPVGQDGRFSFMADLTSPYEYPDWQIKIIHARGVACTEITLPEEETAVTVPGNGRSLFTITAVPI